MRKECRTENTTTLKRLSGYHYGNFESNKFFNSDRPILLDSNFKVSANNTASTLSIKKVGSEIGGYGIEWEMVAPNLRTPDKGTILCNLVDMVFEKVFPADLFKTESDCTVDIECVSQVMSKAFIRNNYKNFKACYDRLLTGFGITTNSFECGMHVNISASLFGKTATERTENARKLGYLINKHYNTFKIAFNRYFDPHNTCWCPQMTTNKETWKSGSISSFPVAHNQCCYNWHHWNNGNGRIEIRLVGGQKNFSCFRNTMEVVFFLMENINKLSWNDLDDLVKVFKGCNSYVFDRLTKCRNEMVMTDDDIAKIRPTVKQVNYI